MRHLFTMLALAAATASLAACDDRPAKPDPNRAPPAALTARAIASGSAAAPGPTAAATATAAASGEAAALAGTWEGKFDAQKGSVMLPSRVKDKALAADDGKRSSGAGTIQITIGADGEVRGKGSGALGALVLTGKVDGGIVRISVFPEDPHHGDAMTGTLIGPPQGDAIHATLRVAGRDATIVREAVFDLKRK